MVATYLSEQRVSKVEEAAVFADEYVLAHKAISGDLRAMLLLTLLALKLAAMVLILQFLLQRLVVLAMGTLRISSFVLFCFFVFFDKKPGHVIVDCYALSKKYKAAKPLELIASVPCQLHSVGVSCVRV